jgi:hypothetical protein
MEYELSQIYFMLLCSVEPQVFISLFDHMNHSICINYFVCLQLFWSRDTSVGIALGYGLDDQGSRVRFPAGAGNFSITASRTALGPTQPPIQWVPEALSLGAKRPRREADHSPPSSAVVKVCVELYLHSPIRLHGLVLSCFF